MKCCTADPSRSPPARHCRGPRVRVTGGGGGITVPCWGGHKEVQRTCLAPWHAYARFNPLLPAAGRASANLYPHAPASPGAHPSSVSPPPLQTLTLTPSPAVPAYLPVAAGAEGQEAGHQGLPPANQGGKAPAQPGHGAPARGSPGRGGGWGVQGPNPAQSTVGRVAKPSRAPPGCNKLRCPRSAREVPGGGHGAVRTMGWGGCGPTGPCTPPPVPQRRLRAGSQAGSTVPAHVLQCLGGSQLRHAPPPPPPPTPPPPPARTRGSGLGNPRAHPPAPRARQSLGVDPPPAPSGLGVEEPGGLGSLAAQPATPCTDPASVSLQHPLPTPSPKWQCLHVVGVGVPCPSASPPGTPPRLSPSQGPEDICRDPPTRVPSPKGAWLMHCAGGTVLPRGTPQHRTHRHGPGHPHPTTGLAQGRGMGCTPPCSCPRDPTSPLHPSG